MQEILFYLIISPFVIAVGIIVLVFLKDTYKQFKDSPKKFFNNLLKIIGVILLIGLVFLLKPVWIGIYKGFDKGFEEVWENVRSMWVIIILKNIIKYLFIIFYWIFWTGTTFGFIYVIGLIPITIVNIILKLISGRDKIPIFKFPPKKDFFEIVSLITTSVILIIPMIWVFIYFLWPILFDLNYKPLY